MTPKEVEKVDLDTPAFGAGSEEIKTVTEPVEEVTKEEKPEANSGEEQMVKYSRFKKFHDEALQYKAEAEEWKRKAETYRPEEKEETSDTDLPSYWVSLYGDSPASKEAWKVQTQHSEALIQQVREEALEAVRNEKIEEVQRTERNIQTIDNELETLTDFVGRNLTGKEQEAVLDIVDEFTPKDGDGNYTGSMIPFEKAWEIYELKQGASSNSRRAARDNVASASGAPSQGVPSGDQAERDKNFNPLDWDAARRRLQGL